ncbi:MAG: hypothetical protein ACOYNP_14755 [Gemmataceae bacterium]
MSSARVPLRHDGTNDGQVRTGHAVEALAALRNAVIALLRTEG